MHTPLHDLIETFFTKLGLSITSLTIDIVETDINIRIETPDSALLIGMHGKNLESFTHVLSRLIEKVTEKHLHIHLEVNDYMKQKDEKFFHFLESKINTVRATGNPARIENLTSFERKKAHQYIVDRSFRDITSHSAGEGTSRALILELSISSNTQTITPLESRGSLPSTANLPEDGIGI
jgi:predicted RNA-binding protein Jag